MACVEKFVKPADDRLNVVLSVIVKNTWQSHSAKDIYVCNISDHKVSRKMTICFWSVRPSLKLIIF